MQLFSIGLWQLNMDGTKKLRDGQPIHAYDSDDIMTMARAWTGFTRAPRNRGNAESEKWGPHVEPMTLTKEFRDIYPKSDLLGGYIGDRHPLCVDLPSKHHLRKGAIYRLLGKSSIAEMQSGDLFRWEGNEHILRVQLEESSPLYEKICTADSNGACSFPGKVVLPTTLIYDSTILQTLPEYLSETVRTVRIQLGTKHVYYEYIRPSCVEQAFLGSTAKKVILGNIG